MPGWQSSEPGFESPFVTLSKIGHFRSLHWRPSWLSCMNEYLAIDSGGHVSDLVLARNCCLARMLPREAELVSEWTGLPREANGVKRFEQSNRLATALYKNYLYLYIMYNYVLSQLSVKFITVFYFRYLSGKKIGQNQDWFQPNNNVQAVDHRLWKCVGFLQH